MRHIESQAVHKIDLSKFPLLFAIITTAWPYRKHLSLISLITCSCKAYAKFKKRSSKRLSRNKQVSQLEFFVKNEILNQMIDQQEITA
jgi:hypothetical protein